MAVHYKDIIDYLGASGMDFKDNVLDLIPCPELRSSVVLRDYQQQALDAWIAGGRRGVIVLPTGSGKTLIGMKAISLLNVPAIVVAPTIDLMNQWRSRLEKEFKIEIGLLGGKEQEVA